MNYSIVSVSMLAAFCAVCSAASADRVKIDSGELRGAVSGGVVAFKGVPFAAPPIGANRWRAPQPVKPWSGVRPATDLASDCAQLLFPGDAAPAGTTPNEDCLYMNVWTPTQRSAEKLPVMVWIYGGGFVNGGSSPAVYDGGHFAERGVVFVSFNYRVGRFGFFAHPAITAENPDGPLGNYAFMDQIAALQWVQRNIPAFGGDPHNVTIFGESAGGISVLTLMTSPPAKGLFQKAIVESGGGRRLFPTPNLSGAEKIGLAFAKDAGVSGEDSAALSALRNLPAERVVNHLNMATMGPQSSTYAGPMIDGKIVVETVEDAFLAGHETKIPVIAGANSQDIGFSNAKTMEELFAPFGADSEKAMTVYNPEKGTDVRAIGWAVAADRMMIEPARFVVRTMAAAGQTSYEYRFSYVAESLRKNLKGAPHATEIPFVFDTVAARYGKNLMAADEATAHAGIAYWVNFAKTGDPNGDGLPKWPAYRKETDLVMDFTNNGPVAGPDAWRTRLDLAEGAASSATK